MHDRSKEQIGNKMLVTVNPKTDSARQPAGLAKMAGLMVRLWSAIAIVSVMALNINQAAAGPEAVATDDLDQVVNIYSYRQPFLIEPILKRFSESTGIKTQIIFAKKGLVERIQAEGKYSPADLILTSDFATLIRATKVAQPVTSNVLNTHIPENARASDNRWFGLSWRARIVYASRERVKDNQITYEELADEKWQGRICIRDGQHPYNIGLFASLISHHGETWTRDWLTGLRKNLAVKPSGNDRAQVRNVYAAVCDIAIGNTYYMGKMQNNKTNPEQQNWAKSVRIIFPNTEDRGVHANVSGMAMAKFAPNPETAKALMEYLVSADAQSAYAKVNYEYPVREDIKPSKQVVRWGAFNPDPIPLDSVNANAILASKLVDEVQFNSGP